MTEAINYHPVIQLYICDPNGSWRLLCFCLYLPPPSNPPRKAMRRLLSELGNHFSYVQPQMWSWQGFGISSTDTTDHYAAGASLFRHL